MSETEESEFAEAAAASAATAAAERDRGEVILLSGTCYMYVSLILESPNGHSCRPNGESVLKH